MPRPKPPGSPCKSGTVSKNDFEMSVADVASEMMTVGVDLRGSTDSIAIV